MLEDFNATWLAIAIAIAVRVAELRSQQEEDESKEFQESHCCSDLVIMITLTQLAFILCLFDPKFQGILKPYNNIAITLQGFSDLRNCNACR